MKPEYCPLAQTMEHCVSLLERYIRKIRLHTLLKAIAAVFAIKAGVSEPLDTDAIAKFDGLILSVFADGDYNTDTLLRRSVA